jgi:hypothetical protein
MYNRHNTVLNEHQVALAYLALAGLTLLDEARPANGCTNFFRSLINYTYIFRTHYVHFLHICIQPIHLQTNHHHITTK